jgi:predicted RNA-binding Zn ribbon-like protein
MSIRPLKGEPLPLDLVDTQWREHGVPVDGLAEPGAAEAWLAEHGLARATAAAVEPLLQARRAIRIALEHDRFTDLNAVLDHGRIRPGLDNAGPTETIEIDDPAWLPAWTVARALVDLVRDAPPGRIRHCDGAGCVLWFLDTSRNGRRRWCSMAGCGNRAKARAHYSRTPS